MIEGTDFDIAVAVLALFRAKRIGPSQAREFLGDAQRLSALRESHASAHDVLEMLGLRFGEINGTLAEARRLLEKGVEHGIVPIHLGHPRYPNDLRSILDAPPILHVRGDVSVLEKLPGVAIVGTRNATAHGLTIAERIASTVGAVGYPIISGLALGIDAAAHEGALKANATTIAVLAHGLRAASPRTNAHLAARILENGGAWVSEHAIDVPALPEYFVHRNRIQVGLSCASIIVEGRERSGSMTQAEFCLRNKRALFAVLPEGGKTVSTQHELPMMLVRERGATPIRSKDDYPEMLASIKQRKDEMGVVRGA